MTKLNVLDIHRIAVEACYKQHALQKPEELYGLLRLLKPSDRILEIGCDAGGLTWALKQLGCYVVGITLQNGPFSSGYPLQTKPDILILGDSHDPHTVQRLNDHYPKRFDFLFIDGDHTTKGVWQDYEMYSPYINGMIGFHDICHHNPDLNVGVENVWRTLSQDYRNIEFVYPPINWGGIGIINYSEQPILDLRVQECLKN